MKFQNPVVARNLFTLWVANDEAIGLLWQPSFFMDASMVKACSKKFKFGSFLKYQIFTGFPFARE